MGTLRSVKVYSCLIVLLFFLAGCEKTSEPELSQFNTTNLERLHAGYCMFWMANGYRGPKDEQELKDFLTTDAGAKVRLERIGVSQDQVLGLFVNERDGQPFKVRYGVNGPGDKPVIFEAEGVNGMRFVAYDEPIELAQDEYERCWSGQSGPREGSSDPFGMQ